MNDLISRQAAIEHLKKRLYETALNNDTEHPYYEEMADNRVSVWLEEVPSVEPKRGKWERHVLKNANVPWGYDCSACGAWFVVGEDTVEKYYYCPNCGAKMERSEE